MGDPGPAGGDRCGSVRAVRSRREGSVVNWEDTIVAASATDTGMRRTNNQDSHAVVRARAEEAWRRRGHLFMVADGMGAHAVGELASKLACDNIPHHYLKSKTGAPAEAMVKAYREVGAMIHSKATANREFEGMGTTCSTLLLLPEGALIGHVGDSRIYRARGTRIDQLTFDHSLVWELVKRKHLTPEQMKKGHGVPRNVITRSLGPDPTVEVDVEGPLPVEPGDVFLLCSDGLSGLVDDPELGAFAANFHPDDSCKYLLHLANLRGGQDNITVVVLRVGPWAEPGSPEADAPAAGGKSRSRGGRGSFLSGLIGTLQRKPVAPPVEEHLYVSEDCPIDGGLLDRLGDQLRQVQATAVEKAWPVDWPGLTAARKAADSARSSGDHRAALRQFGESIVRLGIAGRLHRKEHGPNGSH